MPNLLLTGGSRGIGKAIKEKFEQHGYQVFAPGRNEMNLSDSESVEGYLRHFDHPIDAFVHSAGINFPKPFETIEQEDLELTLQVNALSFYQIANHLVKHNLINDQGAILAIASIYGSITRRGRFSYTASKYALIGMVKTLALELGERHIRVNTLSPGFIDTELTRQNNSPEVIRGFEEKIALQRLGKVEEVANIVYFLCSPENAFITGQDIIADGGYSIGAFEK